MAGEKNNPAPTQKEKTINQLIKMKKNGEMLKI